MAKVSMALAELVETGANDDVVCELLTHVVQRLMDFEIEQRGGARYGERGEERSNSRKGYRGRLWKTRAGSIDLAHPEASLRELLCRFSRPRRTAEKELLAVI